MDRFVSEITEYKKNKYKVCMDDGTHLVLYKGEVRRYRLQEGQTVDEALYQELFYEVVGKRVKKRALALLEKMDRTEQLPDVSCCNFLPQIQQKRRFVLPLYHAKLLNCDYRIARFAPFCKRKTDFFAFCPQTAPFRSGFRCICTKDKKKTATSR